MSDNFDQHDAHTPTPSPSGARQDGHSGGSATSRATRSAARNPPRNCVSREGASSWLAETSSFILQMYQMPQSPTIFDRKLLRARQQLAVEDGRALRHLIHLQHEGACLGKPGRSDLAAHAIPGRIAGRACLLYTS